MRSRRRLLVVGATALAAPRVVFAQAPGKPLRVGFLVPTTRNGYAPRIEGFKTGLREFGYIEGKNLLIEYRTRYEVRDDRQYEDHKALGIALPQTVLIRADRVIE